mgnify:CR=1 FL=1
MNNIEHEYTSNIVCPYCGYEDKDSWERSDDSDIISCNNCDKIFSYTRWVDVSYCTYKESEVGNE